MFSGQPATPRPRPPRSRTSTRDGSSKRIPTVPQKLANSHSTGALDTIPSAILPSPTLNARDETSSPASSSQAASSSPPPAYISSPLEPDVFNSTKITASDSHSSQSPSQVDVSDPDTIAAQLLAFPFPSSSTNGLVGNIVSEGEAPAVEGEEQRVTEKWVKQRSRDELDKLLMEADRVIREREKELSVAAAIGKSLLEHNLALRTKHEALLSSLPLQPQRTSPYHPSSPRNLPPLHNSKRVTSSSSSKVDTIFGTPSAANRRSPSVESGLNSSYNKNWAFGSSPSSVDTKGRSDGQAGGNNSFSSPQPRRISVLAISTSPSRSSFANNPHSNSISSRLSISPSPSRNQYNHSASSSVSSLSSFSPSHTPTSSQSQARFPSNHPSNSSDPYSTSGTFRSRRTPSLTASPQALAFLRDQNAELAHQLELLQSETASADVAGRKKLRKLEKEIEGLRFELAGVEDQAEGLRSENEELKKRKALSWEKGGEGKVGRDGGWAERRRARLEREWEESRGKIDEEGEEIEGLIKKEDQDGGLEEDLPTQDTTEDGVQSIIASSSTTSSLSPTPRSTSPSFPSNPDVPLPSPFLSETSSTSHTPRASSIPLPGSSHTTPSFSSLTSSTDPVAPSAPSPRSNQSAASLNPASTRSPAHLDTLTRLLRKVCELEQANEQMIREREAREIRLDRVMRDGEELRDVYQALEEAASMDGDHSEVGSDEDESEDGAGRVSRRESEAGSTGTVRLPGSSGLHALEEIKRHTPIKSPAATAIQNDFFSPSSPTSVRSAGLRLPSSTPRSVSGSVSLAPSRQQQKTRTLRHQLSCESFVEGSLPESSLPAFLPTPSPRRRLPSTSPNSSAGPTLCQREASSSSNNSESYSSSSAVADSLTSPHVRLHVIASPSPSLSPQPRHPSPYPSLRPLNLRTQSFPSQTESTPPNSQQLFKSPLHPRSTQSSLRYRPHHYHQKSPSETYPASSSPFTGDDSPLISSSPFLSPSISSSSLRSRAASGIGRRRGAWGVRAGSVGLVGEAVNLGSELRGGGWNEEEQEDREGRMDTGRGAEDDEEEVGYGIDGGFWEEGRRTLTLLEDCDDNGVVEGRWDENDGYGYDGNSDSEQQQLHLQLHQLHDQQPSDKEEDDPVIRAIHTTLLLTTTAQQALSSHSHRPSATASAVEDTPILPTGSLLASPACPNSEVYDLLELAVSLKPLYYTPSRRPLPELPASTVSTLGALIAEASETLLSALLPSDTLTESNVNDSRFVDDPFFDFSSHPHAISPSGGEKEDESDVEDERLRMRRERIEKIWEEGERGGGGRGEGEVEMRGLFGNLSDEEGDDDGQELSVRERGRELVRLAGREEVLKQLRSSSSRPGASSTIPTSTSATVVGSGPSLHPLDPPALFSPHPFLNLLIDHLNSLFLDLIFVLQVLLIALIFVSSTIWNGRKAGLSSDITARRN